MITKQVLIIGGGCAGLWLAHELSGSRVKVGVIDTEPYSSFSTTRNQGWLQSGAFYAAREDPVAAHACARGFQIIKEFAPETVNENVPAFFLFEKEIQLHDTLARCASLEIFANAVPYLELENSVPILDPGERNYHPFRFAAKVLDCPVDTHHLMHIIAERAASRGAEYFPTSKFSSITFRYQGDRWIINLDNSLEIVCDIVVLACGASIPYMLNRLIPHQVDVPALALTKVPVLVLHGSGFNSLLATPFVRHGPSLVPFRSEDGVGATVCLTQADQEIQAHDDFDLPTDYLRLHSKSLRTWLPGINSIITEHKIHAHFYVCQKLQSSIASQSASRAHLLLDHAPESGAPKTVLTLYPGKMTAALSAAEECTKKIIGLLQGSSPESSNAVLPTIAKQPYFNAPSHFLSVRKSRLAFEAMHPD